MDAAVVPEDESKIEEDKEGGSKNASPAKPPIPEESNEVENPKAAEDSLYAEADAVLEAANAKNATKTPSQAVTTFVPHFLDSEQES
jgi:hypothetical protein